MIETRTISGALRVRVTRLAPALPASLEARVAALWEEEVGRRGDDLFDGSILSVVHAGSDLVEGEITDYRRLIAQRADPDLRARLAVRPLAVSGLLRCAEGVVFAKRSPRVTEAGGRWELAPSGGLDAAGLVPDEPVEPQAQILTELSEELGVPASSVEPPTPFCLVDDHDTGIVDIGIELRAPTLRAGDLVDHHRRAGSDEYDEVTAVLDADLAPFVAAHPDLIPVSVALLAARGLL
jgi:hypothetical protein